MKKDYTDLTEIRNDFPSISNNQIEKAKKITNACAIPPFIHVDDFDDDEFPPSICLWWSVDIDGKMDERSLMIEILDLDGVSIWYGLDGISRGMKIGDNNTIEEALELYNAHCKQFALARDYSSFGMLDDKEQDFFLETQRHLFFHYDGDIIKREKIRGIMNCAEYIYACCDIKPVFKIVSEQYADCLRFCTDICLVWYFPCGGNITIACENENDISVGFEFGENVKLYNACIGNRRHWFDSDCTDFYGLVDKVDFVSYFKEKIEPYAIECKHLEDEVTELESLMSDCETPFPEVDSIVYIFHQVKKQPDFAGSMYYKWFEMDWNEDKRRLSVIHCHDDVFDVTILDNDDEFIYKNILPNRVVTLVNEFLERM